MEIHHEQHKKIAVFMKIEAITLLGTKNMDQRQTWHVTVASNYENLHKLWQHA